MMTYAAITILTALVAATVWSIVTARRISAAFRKGRMLAESHGYGSDAMSQLGVSIIVSGLDAAEDIEQRLASEYWRYEVIVVLDSSAQALELARLQRKYSLILVNYPAVADIPIEGTPLLYRSRQRRYRRLVVIDRRHRNPNDDLNCGINVASYEQIVPLDANTFLTDDAVRRLEVELNDSGIHSTQAVLFPVRPMSLGDRHGIAAIRRDAIVDAGGFDPKPVATVHDPDAGPLFDPPLRLDGASAVGRGPNRRPAPDVDLHDRHTHRGNSPQTPPHGRSRAPGQTPRIAQKTPSMVLQGLLMLFF